MSESIRVATNIRKKITPGQAPEEESAQIDKLVRQWGLGFNQVLQGESTDQLVELFLARFDEEAIRDIEGGIENLHGMADLQRFRKRMLLFAATLYANGVEAEKSGCGFDFEKLCEEAGMLTHERHKDVLLQVEEAREKLRKASAE